jgi:hypothetical protein
MNAATTSAWALSADRCFDPEPTQRRVARELADERPERAYRLR